jgi:parallel beta-helix repeat protein
MKNITSKIIMITCPLLLLISSLCGCINPNQPNIIVGQSSQAQYQSIQNAIDNATEGDIIYVENGIYHEPITIKKTIQLKGESRDNTIIDYTGDIYKTSIIFIEATSCSIQGFTLSSSGEANDVSGIRISSDQNTISNIKIHNTTNGIYIDNTARNNIISNNILYNNSHGIRLFVAYSNKITNNLITENIDSGIRIKDSYDNHIYKNIITKNTVGVYLCCGARDNIHYENDFNQNIEQHVKGAADNVFYQDKLGNYWDNYNGTDTDNNGIGDSPYTIEEGGPVQDNYPLFNKPDIQVNPT